MNFERLSAVGMPESSGGRPSTITTKAMRHIERCARTCYKSEDRIDECTSRTFVNHLIEAGHTAMLEHATIYMKMPICERVHFYRKNPHSIVNGSGCHYYITTNYRVIVENKKIDDLKFAVPPEPEHTKRFTIKFVCNRQVSHEFVRHRTMSFAQESTRFCNYSKGRFGKSLTFVLPEWLDECRWYVKFFFKAYLKIVEMLYFFLVWYGWSAEKAAQILPNCLKTELIVTADEKAWSHFIDLRLFGKTGKPHPQAKDLAEQAYHILKERKIL